MINKKINAVLFDFDGTLADTSKDMVCSLNILLKKKLIKPVNINFAKNFISTGAGGLIDYACPQLSKDERSLYIQEYLNIYKKNLFIDTHLFDGISKIIDLLVFKNYKWGIVTNKPGFLVNPIIKLFKPITPSFLFGGFIALYVAWFFYLFRFYAMPYLLGYDVWGMLAFPLESDFSRQLYQLFN